MPRASDDPAPLLRRLLAAARREAGPGGLIGLDLFGGTGSVSRAWRRMGHGSVLIDVSAHESLNINDVRLQRIILGWIRSRRVHMVFLAPPCSSWSRARRGPPGGRMPQALRSKQSVMGLADLNEKDQNRVRVGNQTMRFSVRVLRECAKQGLPAGLENPLTSWFFEAPPVRSLRAAPWSAEVVLDQCQFHQPWRKPTRLVFVQANHLERLAKRCHMSGGLCSATNKFHIQLTGVCPATKQFWTSHAQEYSPALAAAIAKTLVVSSESRRMRVLAHVVGEFLK